MKSFNYIYFDKSSFSNWTKIENKISTNKNFKAVDEKYYRMELKQVEILHAMLLMGAYPSRFGHDLRIYLPNILNNFSVLSNNGNAFTLLLSSTPDHKKRMAEDLGVTIGSLFMTKIFDIDWQKIAQIPTSTSLIKKRPDFIAFNKGDEPYLFECKGTTQLGQFQKSTDKARQQVKTFPVDAINKIGIVSFIPSDIFDPMPFTFIFDPPENIPFKIDSKLAEQLHYENILRFIGINDQADAYVKDLKQSILAEQKEEQNIFSKISPPVWSKRHYNYEHIIKQLKVEVFRNKKFYGRYIHFEDLKAKIFLGYNSDLDLSQLDKEDDPNVSVFSNGTILILEK